MPKLDTNNRYVRLGLLWFGGIAVLMIPLFYVQRATNAPWEGITLFAALVSAVAVNWISWKVF